MVTTAEPTNHECKIPGVNERAEETSVVWADVDVEELAASCFKMFSRSTKEKVGDEYLVTAPAT